MHVVFCCFFFNIASVIFWERECAKPIFTVHLVGCPSVVMLSHLRLTLYNGIFRTHTHV